MGTRPGIRQARRSFPLRERERGGRVRAVRVVVAALAAFVALLALAPAASAAPTSATEALASVATSQIGGLEYAATATEGRFGGAASGPVPGAWLATVVHSPLQQGKAVPITGGSFTLRGRERQIGGTFVRGTVTPLSDGATCGNQRFDVTGTLALDDGGRGAFRVTLTHLRAASNSGCHTFGAFVAGSLTVPGRGVTEV